MSDMTPLRASLATPRLTLRPPRGDDAEVVARHLQDWEIVRWLARLPHPYSLEHAQAWISWTMESDELSLAICKEDRLIGAIGLRPPLATPFLGYWLARPYWGQGLASEAAHALVAHAFALLEVERILSGYFADNAASGRVLAKLGFTPTGSSMKLSLAQGKEVAHIDMALRRAPFEGLTP